MHLPRQIAIRRLVAVLAVAPSVLWISALSANAADSATHTLVGNSNSYCVVLSSGGVNCWGGGGNGQLGNGKYGQSKIPAIPVVVKSATGSGSLKGVKSITAGGGNYCAILNTGGVNCWGLGGGQLGNGLTKSSAIPVVVKSTSRSGALTGVKSLAAGGGSYCAVLISGGVNCWGRSGSGQLGNGHVESSAIPVVVKSTTGVGVLLGVKSLTAGENGYCALLASGGVNCWGYGDSGQLGNGKFSNSAIPVVVKSTSGSGALTGVKSLAAGGSSYCAVLKSGGVNCWGGGSLGNGKFSNSAIPVVVKSATGSGSLKGVKRLASSVGYNGNSSYCAVLKSGGVNCWGDGPLGNGTLSNSAKPVVVKSTTGYGSLTGVKLLTAGESSYCALLSSGGVDCWGYGGSGQLGNGPTDDSDTPVVVTSTTGSGALAGVAH